MFCFVCLGFPHPSLELHSLETSGLVAAWTVSPLHPREAEGPVKGGESAGKKEGLRCSIQTLSITKKVRVIDDPQILSKVCQVPGWARGAGHTPALPETAPAQSGVQSPLPQKDLLRGR